MFFLLVKHVFLHKNIYFRASWNHVVLYSWLRAISLQRYSVTVPYGEYFCLHQKENCSWLRAISLQRYSVTVPFKGVCRQRKFASLLGFCASERVLLKAGGVVN